MSNASTFATTAALQQVATSAQNTSTVPHFVNLWPPAELPTSYSTAHVLHSFLQTLQSASPQLIHQYRKGAILIVAPSHDANDVPTDLQSSVSHLSSLLSLPVYVHTSATQQLHEAVQLMQTPSSSQQLQQTRLQDQQSIPDWMLIVDPSQGIGCMSIERSEDETKITNGGVVRMQLIDYKRKGEHGFDESSPIVQACFASTPVSNVDEVKCEIVDLTMGLGVDSFVLASFGATVTMIEREPIFALLMLDALHLVSTVPKHSHPIMQKRIEEVSEIVSRLRLILGESAAYLQSLSNRLPVQQPRVLYVDPFYPEPPPSELAKLQESMSGKAVKLQKSITAAKSKKGIELARLIWKETQPLDNITSSSPAETLPTTTDAGFHASPTNLALYSLLSSALNVGSHTRVVLKQPSTPYARRLLTRQMGFEFTKTFQVRDTAFHILGHKQVKQSKGDDDDAAASSAPSAGKSSSSSKSADPVKKKAAANKKKQSSRSSSPGSSSNSHRRSFHSSSSMASPSNSASSSVPFPSTSAAVTTAALASPPSLTGYYFEPIGHIRTVFVEKFSIPRQSSLAPSARAVLTLTPETAKKFKVDSWNKSVQNLDTFSHAWLIFVFHQHHEPQAVTRQPESSPESASSSFSPSPSSAASASSPPEILEANNPRAPDEYVWNETVRPPRLGGDVRVGVFASRSPYRPNPIGMSCVRIEKVVMSETDGNAEVHFSGVDLLDGTPILDIKPWISYCDGMQSTPEYPLRLGWAEEPVRKWNVKWLPEASELVDKFQREIDASASVAAASSSSSPSTTASPPIADLTPAAETMPRTPIRSLVEDLLSLDPRHGYQQKSHPVNALKSAGRSYGFRVTNWNVAYEMDGQGTFIVKHIETMEDFKKKHAERVKRAEEYARKMNL